MAQSSKDAQLQEHLVQLNVIVSRRNEFLRELFRMTRMREGINAVPTDDDDDEMEAFLNRFDLEKNLQDGSISNMTDAEMSFPIRATTPFHTRSTNSSVDGASLSSTRALRRRGRADDSALALERSRAPGALEKAIARSTESGRFSSPPRSRRVPRSMEVDTDEDNDELDLIGPVRFSDDFEQGESDPGRKTTGIFKPLTSRETSEQPPARRYTPTPPSKEESMPKVPDDEDVLEEEEASELQLENFPPDKSGESVQNIEVEEEEEEEEVLKEDEISKPKDQAMEVEDDEIKTAIEDGKGPGAVGREATVTSIEDPSSTNATVDPADAATKFPQEVPSREPLQFTQPSSTPSSLPSSPQKIHILPLQIQPSVSQDEHAFKMDTSADSQVRKGSNVYLEVDSMGHFSPTYILPPLSILPPDFTKKAKSIKRSKKEKESKRDKEDTVPLGLAKWSATLMANPLWRKVARATKTLSTREWSVAMTELRLVRTVERIESLKNDGRWSFRQPKKQRGVGGLTKSHWDYLLEEMKWMRTDFREERRWKLALAYNLSTAVLEWHFAKSQEEREKAGIIVKWMQPKTISLKESTGELSMDMSSDDLPTTTTTRTTAQLLGVDYGSDDDDEPDSRQNVLDSLAPSAAVQDALEAASEILPKREDFEDSSALQLMQVADTLDVADQETPDSRTEDDIKMALKSNSDNPLLSGSKSSSQSINGDSEPATPMSKKASKSALNPVRERIVHSDDLFLDIGAELQNLSIKSKSKNPDVPSILDVVLLFPDLQPFGMLDVSPGPPLFTTEEKKKKSEKKTDREDPAKRLEDTTYTKLHPTGRFMQSKPTLIGPLQPAKRFLDGKWLPIDPQPVTADLDAKIPEDISNELFEGRPAGSSLQMHGASFNKTRRTEQLWTQADDTLLRQLVDRYSSNWALVAECYNSSRLTTTTERRTPVECMERWKERWSAEKKMQAVEPSPAMPSSDDVGSSSIVSSSSQSQMTTRGVKRLASVSVSSAQGISIGGEKKRRRHYLLQDSIKRAAKKRTDAVQKMLVNQRKPSAVHETHNQYNKLPKLTPLELARMKADRDQRETQDFQLARRRQEEALRSNLLREQAQRAAQGQVGQVPTNQGQPQPQQAQAAQAAPPPPSAQAAQPTQAPASVSQVQGGQPAPAQQPALPPQLQPQQLAQLQQLQAQQASQAAGRLTMPAVGNANRPPTRMAAVPPTVRVANPQAQAQAQLLQQARMQLPMQFPAGTNLAHVLSQAQATGNAAAHGTSNPYYANLSNLTQEQLLAFMQSNQQQAQQHAQQQQPAQQAQQPGIGGATANGFTSSS